MPRIRTVKPEFWSDEKLATVSEASLLVAIGLLNLADDQGYFNANPKLIDAFIFPLRDSSMSVHGAIAELSNIGYIDVYRCVKNEKDIGLIRNFALHQVISRPTASKLAPAVDLSNHSLINHGVVSEDSTQERKGKEQGKEQGKEGKGREVGSVKINNYIEESKVVFEYWVSAMNKSSRATLTDLRKSKVVARLKANYTLSDIKLAIDNVAKDEFLVAGGHTDIEMICRSDTNLEKYRDMVKKSPQGLGQMQENFNALSGVTYDRS